MRVFALYFYEQCVIEDFNHSMSAVGPKSVRKKAEMFEKGNGWAHHDAITFHVLKYHLGIGLILGEL